MSKFRMTRSSRGAEGRYTHTPASIKKRKNRVRNKIARASRRINRKKA